MMPDYPIRLVIPGRPIVWKRGKSAFIRLGYGKGQPCPRCQTPLLATPSHTPRQNKWMKDAINQLMAQWTQRDPIPKATLLNAAIVSYLPTRALPDLDNSYCGPQDAMQRAGVLEDDKCIRSHNGSGLAVDKKRPRVEITLTIYSPISLSLHPPEEDVEF